MVKQASKNLIELGDKIFHKKHLDISGIVTLIGRNTQDVLQIALEEYSEDAGTILVHDLYIEDALGVNDEVFSDDPKDYDEYFPKDDEGEYKFKLNETYQDVYTELKGVATSHSVCITGCDRTKLTFKKKNSGLYIMWIDLNRITLVDELETQDSAINENRREPGGPIEMCANSL